MLLNNAGVAVIGRSFEGLDSWNAVMSVNLFGCVLLRIFIFLLLSLILLLIGYHIAC